MAGSFSRKKIMSLVSSFPLQLVEPDIEITPRDHELHVTVYKTVKLNCTAWKTDHDEKKRKKKKTG